MSTIFVATLRGWESIWRSLRTLFVLWKRDKTNPRKPLKWFTSWYSHISWKKIHHLNPWKHFFFIYSLQLRRVIFQFSMETDSFDLDRFVPFKSVKDINTFCSADDGMLLKKKDALTRRIYAACDTSSLTNFVSTVSNALFDPAFIRTHRWPTQK